jgi:hypothetical protein
MMATGSGNTGGSHGAQEGAVLQLTALVAPLARLHIVAHLLIILPTHMGPEGTIPCSQQPTSEPDKSIHINEHIFLIQTI